jgi:predicted DNA-binding antitoxin AbrB/MazE fold protein
MTITLHAPHSKEYKKVLHEMTNKRLKKMQSKGKPDITAEELEEVSLDSLAKTTKGWNLTYNGEKPELSLDKAREIYDKVFWIKAQIEEASEELLGFMRA